MKKLLLTLVAAVLAIGASAQATLYMVGSGGPGLSWTLPGMTLTATNNKYTYTFTAGTQPEFKVSTAYTTSDWNNTFNPNCLTVSSNQQNGIQANHEYECTIGGNTNNIKAPAKDDYTLEIEYRNGKYYLNLKTASGQAPEITYPEKVYVPGASAGWAVNASYILNRQNEQLNAQGQIIYKGTVPTLSGDFKIAEDPAGWSGLNFGAGATATVPTNGTPVEAVGGSTTNFNVSGTLTNPIITFTYEPQGTSTVAINSTTGPTYPNTLYMIGDAWDWDPTKGAQGTGSNGVFTFNNVEGGESLGFSFCEKLNSDWSQLGLRYTPGYDDVRITAAGEYDIVQATDKCWYLPASDDTYSITVDIPNMKMTVSGSFKAPALYLVGTMTDWKFEDAMMFTTDDDVHYTLKNVAMSASDKFKIADKSWTYAYSYMDNYITLGGIFPFTQMDGENTDAQLAQGVENGVITFDLSNGNFTITGTPVEAPEAVDLYIRGEMNDWGAVAAWKFATKDNVNYTLSGVTIEAGQMFKVADADWNEVNTYSYTKAPMELDTPYTMENNYGDTDETNSTLAVTVENATVTYNILTHVFRVTGTGSGEVEDPEQPDAALYVIGTIKNLAWPAKGVAMTEAINIPGVYTASNVEFVAAEGNDYGFFGFAEVLGTWDEVNAFRYGPLTDGTPASVVLANGFAKTTDNAWSILPGAYDITVDFNGAYMTIKEAAAAQTITFGEITYEVTAGEEASVATLTIPYTVSEGLVGKQATLTVRANVTEFVAEAEGCLEATVELVDEENVVPVTIAVGSVSATEEVVISLAGINAIEADADANVRYFNLQGVEVANPTPGLYIRVANGTPAKVLVK